VRNQRSKWRPPARANHDSDRSCACEQIERMGSEPQFERDRRGRIPPNGSAKSRTRKRTAETPEKPQQKKTTQNRRIRRGARRECDEEREKQKHGESLGEAAVVAMCGRRRTEHRRFEVGRPPADGELGAASTHGHASALARLDLAGSRSRRRFRPLLHHLSLACLPATGRIRIE
jgi:hypothetical protein